MTFELFKNQKQIIGLHEFIALVFKGQPLFVKHKQKCK